MKAALRRRLHEETTGPAGMGLAKHVFYIRVRARFAQCLLLLLPSVYHYVLHVRILDLDLDSTRIQLDALGHTLTPFWSVLSCHLCFLPGDSHPRQILVDYAPPVCTWTTWTSLEPRNLPVQRLSSTYRKWEIHRRIGTGWVLQIYFWGVAKGRYINFLNNNNNNNNNACFV